MLNTIEAALAEAEAALGRLRSDQKRLEAIASAADLISSSLEGGGRVFSCGNGGSMCDAMHFAEELSGKFRKVRRGLAASAISDPAHLTCAANDFGYDEVFSRYVEAHGRKGDVLLAISTSGESPNIIKAADAARSMAMKVIAMTGRDECALAPLADVLISTPANTPYSDRVQELHIKVIHIMIELVERRLFGGADGSLA